MADDRARYRLPSEVVAAVEAVAAMERVAPSSIVERALRAYLNPIDWIEQAAELLRSNIVNMKAISDDLNVISSDAEDRQRLIIEMAAENETLRRELTDRKNRVSAK